MVLMLKHCCCGCTLKTGTLIIAVVFAILAALQVVLYSVTAVEMAESYERWRGWQMEEEEERLPATTSEPLPSVDHDGGQLDLNDTVHDHHHYHDAASIALRIKMALIWKWCMILLSITETIDFFLNILVMFAANKDSARHVLLWLFGFLGTSCCRLLLQIVVFSSIFYIGAIVGGFVVLTISSLIAVGAAYSLVVVLSYYRQLVGTGIARRISQQDD